MAMASPHKTVASAKHAFNESVVRSFRVATHVTEAQHVSSIDFSSDGETMVSGVDNHQIIVYDCNQTKKIRVRSVRKYGVGLVRYTKNPDLVLHTSTKVDHSIRLMNERADSYYPYFRGHTDSVVTICVSPNDDTFLSGALDRTIRLWDLRMVSCIGIMNLSGRPIGAYDPTGQIFGVGVNSSVIKLYDARMYDKGPFVSFKMNEENDCEWIDFKFSPDGKAILINTNGPIIRLIDAYDGIPLSTITNRQNSSAEHIEAAFSPDSQYILSGSTDGMLHIWNADTGHKVCALSREQKTIMRCVRFNPKYMLIATANEAVDFWLPTV